MLTLYPFSDWVKEYTIADLFQNASKQTSFLKLQTIQGLFLICNSIVAHQFPTTIKHPPTNVIQVCAWHLDPLDPDMSWEPWSYPG